MYYIKFFIVIFYFFSVNLSASYVTVCASCHGKNFEKRAFGRSRIVKNMQKEEIIKRLKYFKTSESIMKSYAGRLTDKQIKTIGIIFGK